MIQRPCSSWASCRRAVSSAPAGMPRVPSTRATAPLARAAAEYGSQWSPMVRKVRVTRRAPGRVMGKWLGRTTGPRVIGIVTTVTAPPRHRSLDHPHPREDHRMTASRVLPTEEAADLLGLTREIVDQGAGPAVGRGRGDRDVPARRLPRCSGRAGLLGLPYPEEYGGGGQPYEVYLQVLEEIAAVWSTRRRRASACTRCPASGCPRAAPRSRSSGGCPTCSAASCSAPTASPSRTPAPTRRR